MGMLMVIPAQPHGVGPITVTPTLAEGKLELFASFTRASWPDGPCLRVTYWFPDGSLIGSVTFDGGNTSDRNGQPRSHSGIRGLRGGFLPAGDYTIQFDFLQGLTSAITIQDA